MCCVIIKIGDDMKKVLTILFLVSLFGIVYVNRNRIVGFILGNIVDNNVVMGDANSYYKDVDYGFVQNTTNLYPSSRQDIMNIIYTTLNRGLDNVTFYCDSGYSKCIDDVNEIASDNLILSTINNLVHPFNSYSNIHFSINSYGKVGISVDRIYSQADIDLINRRMDGIIGSIINDGMSNYDKILAFHDYIVNNTIYDNTVSLTNQMYSGTKANNAMGLLFEGKAICSGYSDTMAIFLSRLGLNNYRISSDIHIWNLVYLDGKWEHIDVTWDDPVTSDGSNVLLHDFFLISTDELLNREKSYDRDNHLFEKSYYLEAV